MSLPRGPGDLRDAAAGEVLARALDRLSALSAAAFGRLLSAMDEAGTGGSLAAARQVLLESGEDVAAILEETLLGSLLAGMGGIAASWPAESPWPYQPGALSPSIAASAGARAEALKQALARLDPAQQAAFRQAMAPAPAPEPPAIDGVPPLPLVEAAVEALRSKRLLSIADARSLPAEARSRALPVALSLPAAAMVRLHGLLSESVASGEDLRAFRARLKEAMPEGAFPRAAVEATFRDAVQSAYAAGQERLLAVPGVGELFPFVETLPIRDSRLTDLCGLAARSGIGGTGVYRRDDPAWSRLKPPRHVNCRCGTSPLTADEAARRGVPRDGGFVSISARLDKMLAKHGR